MANQVSTVNQELSVDKEVQLLVNKINRYLESKHAGVPHVFKATSEEVAQQVAQIKRNDHWAVDVYQDDDGDFAVKLYYTPHTR